MLALLSMLISRAVNIFPISLLMNLLRKNTKIPFRHMIMLWFAGLRGAMAFALALDQAPVILTTVLVMCVVTVVVFGGLTGTMLKVCAILFLFFLLLFFFFWFSHFTHATYFQIAARY